MQYDSGVSNAKTTAHFQLATQLSAAAFCSQNCNYKHHFSREMSAMLICLQTTTNTQKFSQLHVASITVAYTCIKAGSQKCKQQIQDLFFLLIYAWDEKGETILPSIHQAGEWITHQGKHFWIPFFPNNGNTYA